MIQNAKDKPLGLQSTGLPDMMIALSGFMQPMKFTVIQQQMVDGYTQEIAPRVVHTRAVRQPFTAQQLMIRPEGDRQWKWETIHAEPDLVLEVNDIIVFSGVRYRVMERYDWKEYGYLQYNIVEDYSGRSTV